MSSLLTLLGVDQLSVADRVRLIAELWDSLPDQPPAVLTLDQEHELDRRAALMDSDPTALRPWEEVEARLLRRLGQ